MSYDEFERIATRRLASSRGALYRTDYEAHGEAARLFDRDWLSGRPEVCLVGPADTGKSRAALEWLHRRRLEYSGSRGLIARKYRVLLTQSAVVTYEQKVLPPGVLGDMKSDKPIKWNSQKQQYEYANGSVIVLAGLDDSEKTYSSEFDDIYTQEVSELTQDDYEDLTRARRNSIVPDMHNVSDMNPNVELHWMHQRCDAGVCVELVARHADNPTITEERLATLRAMSGTRRERLYEGKRVAAVEGAYYAAILSAMRAEGRIGDVPYDPALPVHTGWDIGVDDETAIWFAQYPRDGCHLIDYLEGTGEGVQFYARELQRKPYVYGRHYGPHDIKARSWAADGKTRWEVARALGIRFEVVPRAPDQAAVADGIEAFRNLLATARIDAKRCARGIAGLATYGRRKNPVTGAFSATPEHNWASHPADAGRTLAVGYRETRPMPKAEERRYPWSI